MSGGSLSAMASSIKANNALRKSRREKYKVNQGNIIANNEKLEFKEVSEEELKKINAKNLKKIAEEEQNQFLKFVMIVVVIGIVIFFLFP